MKGAINMKQEFKAVINSDLETGEAIMRIWMPYDDVAFQNFINIACCYNAEVAYVDGALNIKTNNIELISSFVKDCHWLLFMYGICINYPKYLYG